MSLVRSMLVCGLFLSLGSCGPIALGAGISELGDADRQTIVLVLVNDGLETLQLDLESLLGSGALSAAAVAALLPGQERSVVLENSQRVSVRAVETSGSGSRPPVAWDFVIGAPQDGARACLSAVPAVTSVTRDLGPGSPAGLSISSVVAAPGDTNAFASVATTDLPFEPGKVALRPGGAYLYALDTSIAGMVFIHSYRIDSQTGALTAAGTGLGGAAPAPAAVVIQGLAADLIWLVEPSGRVAYLIDNDVANTLSLVTTLEIGDDGVARSPQTTIRGFIADLAFRPDGDGAYTVERLAGQNYLVRELQVGSSGVVGPEASQAVLPCIPATTAVSALAVHPSGDFAYLTFTDAGNVKIGAYFIGAGGLFRIVDSDCSTMETIDDLTFDPEGAFLYASGLVGGQTRVVRYPLDQQTGALGAADTSQDLGAASTLTATGAEGAATPGVPSNLVYVASGDDLSPRTVGSGGVLTELPGNPTQPFGSSASSLLVQGALRGQVTLEGNQ